MKEDTSIIRFRQPGSVEDPLTEIAREGARRMLASALEAEIEAFVGQFAEERLPNGRQRVVRHGYGPERKIQTGIGALEVRRPKVRDRATDVESGKKVRFTSHILPKWARRSRSLDALLPVLYLRGISAGDFQEALAAILGAEAPNLSPGVLSRLTAEWETEHERWQRRDLSARRYVYIWADGVYLQARMEPEAECILVVIGATPEGKKELVGFQVGARESAQSWRELLVDLKARGLAVAPEIAVGDGALGFWKALDEAFPGTAHQRCWVHKIANVLNKVPKSMAPTVTSDLRNIWQAETRAAAEAAMGTFAEKYGTKYGNAVACLTKDREALLTFFDFPAEHWDHLRTANPIESVFATVRHRTVRTKGALSQKTAKLMGFALATKASRGEVVGVARDVRLEGGEVLDLPPQGAYGRTPDGITRYPLAEVGPRWADQAQAAALWVREDPVLRRLAQTVGRVLGDRAIEVIALRDALLFTTLRTVSDAAGPGADPLAQTVRRATVVVLPRGLTLTGEISALGGAAHVIGERLWRIAHGLPEGPLRRACRQVRVVVLPAASGEQDRIRVCSAAVS